MTRGNIEIDKQKEEENVEKEPWMSWKRDLANI